MIVICHLINLKSRLLLFLTSVVLEVIQEATTVDDITVEASRRQQQHTQEQTTRSVTGYYAGQDADYSADMRRVRSANINRHHGECYINFILV